MDRRYSGEEPSSQPNRREGIKQKDVKSPAQRQSLDVTRKMCSESKRILNSLVELFVSGSKDVYNKHHELPVNQNAYQAKIDIDTYFKTQFTSKIEGQDILQPEERAKIAEIDRHTPVSKVPEKWQKTFTLARGLAILEKVKNLPDKDINTIEAFNHRYQNEIDEVDEVDEKGKNEIGEIQEKVKKGKFKVTTCVKGGISFRYINYIDIDNGIITANHNFRDYDARDGGKPLQNSEIFYNQLLLVLKQENIDPSKFNLTRVIREKIRNDETSATLEIYAPSPRNVQSAKNISYRFEKGSDGYYAILGTPNVHGALYLLKQHSGTFGKREITSIEVEQSYYESASIILHINKI